MVVMRGLGSRVGDDGAELDGRFAVRRRKAIAV